MQFSINHKIQRSKMLQKAASQFSTTSSENKDGLKWNGSENTEIVWAYS